MIWCFDFASKWSGCGTLQLKMPLFTYLYKAIKYTEGSGILSFPSKVLGLTLLETEAFSSGAFPSKSQVTLCGGPFSQGTKGWSLDKSSWPHQSGGIKNKRITHWGRWAVHSRQKTLVPTHKMKFQSLGPSLGVKKTWDCKCRSFPSSPTRP